MYIDECDHSAKLWWNKSVDYIILKLLNQSKIESEYDQEIPQSQTDKPIAPRGRASQQSRDTRKTNQSKLSHQGDCKTRMDIK